MTGETPKITKRLLTVCTAIIESKGGLEQVPPALKSEFYAAMKPWRGPKRSILYKRNAAELAARLNLETSNVHSIQEARAQEAGRTKERSRAA